MELDVELEHGLRDLQTNVTHDNEMITGKIALAHLNEYPDYYTRLDKMEKFIIRNNSRTPYHGTVNVNVYLLEI
jgi:hypothetical protein